MKNTIIKRFDKPDEVRVFTKGKFELVNIGGMQLGRATYEAGWVWKEHVGKISGIELCEVEHLGIVLNGQAAVLMRDGKQVILNPAISFMSRPGMTAGWWEKSHTLRCIYWELHNMLLQKNEWIPVFPSTMLGTSARMTALPT